MFKNYKLREKIPEHLNNEFIQFSELERILLYGRGILKKEEAEYFLNPDYSSLNDPYLLKDIGKAVDRILKAIIENQKVAIYSDYDADGIPGAVVLHDFFKKIKFENFINYIPLRNEEGFGLNNDALDFLMGEGVQLLVTIDCGITDVLQVDLANEHKIDVIITDHHIPGDKLPNAYAIINPKQKDCSYPEKMLCGAGVIFKVVQALCVRLRSDLENGNWKLGIETTIFSTQWEKWLLDMVGLATLSDMVPLLGENRIFSFYGLKVLQKSRRPGIVKLLSLLKIKQNSLTEDDVAFMITPRINAASRMGIPKDAFLLLSTNDEVSALGLVEHLNNKNDERKGVVGSMIKEIKKRMDNQETDKRVLVFGNPEWKPSLLGLVASSFSDSHNKPVFFWGRNGESEGIIKGSCRSNGFNVVHLMEKVGDILLDFGGHKGAGGFSILQENIHFLEERLNKAYEELDHTESDEYVYIDKKMSLNDINWENYKKIERFGPFGFGNPKPLFVFENIKVENVKMFGKEQNHLELKFKNSKGDSIVAIAFFKDKDKFEKMIGVGENLNLIGSIEKSEFRNFPELRLRIVEIF